MSRRGKKKDRSGHDEGPTIQIDMARWEAARRRWLLHHIGGGVLLPPFVGYVLYHDSLIKGRPVGPGALLLSGLTMLIFSLIMLWLWRKTSSVEIAPPARVAIKDAPSGERVLLNGSVMFLHSTVVGPASGRQGVHCRLQIQVESHNDKAPPWIPRHTREWSSTFLLEDDLGGSLRLDGGRVHAGSELSELTLVYESKTGVTGLSDQLQHYIQENKISFKESEQRIRVAESVLGEGDELTIIGHLTAPPTQASSLYRTGEPEPRELIGVELMMPISLDDLRRLAADREERTKLLTAGIFVGIGLFIAGALMMRA